MFSSFEVRDNLFDDFHRNGDGGVIYSALSKPLSVYDSIFTNCESSTNGGAIYRSSSVLYSTRCSFFYVRCSRVVNNEGGNVIDCRSSSLILNETSMSFCWINSETGDSPILALTNKMTDLKTVNSSCNCEYKAGSCIIEAINAVESFVISYSTAYNCTNDKLIHGTVTGKTAYVENCNFIDNTVNILIDTWNTLNISNCFLFGNVYSSKIGTGTFYSCYGSFTTSGVEKLETTQTILISFNNLKTIKSMRIAVISCNNRRSHVLSNMHALVFILTEF